ncbi:MAG: S8 family serine peptidase [Blastocatellia bacterium]|nr:S8 family serine peptidase [Blastocatellia bacterium]
MSSRYLVCMTVVCLAVAFTLFPTTPIQTVVLAQKPVYPTQIQKKQPIGQIPELVNHSPVLGKLAATEKIPLVLLFEPRQEGELRQLVEDLYSPQSPRFHQWLTPTEFGDRFGRSPAEFDRAVAWLQSSGFDVAAAWPNRLSISFSGTVATVEKAFQTQLGRFLDTRENRPFYANINLPVLPPELAPFTLNLVGLNNAYPARIPGPPLHRKLNSEEQAGLEKYLLNKRERFQPHGQAPGLPQFMAPKDLALAYNFQPVLNAGIQGQNQRTAVIMSSDILSSDVAKYGSLFGLPPVDLKRLLPPGLSHPGVKRGSGEELEALLDVQSIYAVAPRAEINLVLIPTLDFAPVLTAEQFLVNSAQIPIVNESFGACESFGHTTGEQNLFWQASAQGIAFFAASGDEGSECLFQPGVQAVSTPAAYDGVTAVGGTEIVAQFNANGDVTTIVQEQVWNDPPGVRFDCQDTPFFEPSGGSGGGISKIVPKPIHQLAATGANGGVPFGNFRVVPDVSALAGSPYTLTVQQGFLGLVSGTSVSSPLWVGIMALINQSKGSVQGSPNRELYRLGMNQFKKGEPAVFRDIVAGDNVTGPRQPCAPFGAGGFRALPGYDAATGWGVPNVDVLARNFGVKFGDTTPPAITIVAPKGGESYESARQTAISWEVSETGTIISQSIALSLDSGRTFPLLVATGLAGTARTFSWTVPFGNETPTARLQITATDDSLNEGRAINATDFKIVVPALSPPQNFRALANGPLVQLSWEAPLPNPAVVLKGYNLYRSKTSPVERTDGNRLGTLDVTASSFSDRPVPANGKTAYFYVLTSLLSTGEGPAAPELTVTPDDGTGDRTPPLVKVLAPNGGESLTVGDKLAISWNSTDNSGVTAQTVELSTDNGVRFGIPIAVGLAGNIQSFDFDLPAATVSKAARIRVTARDAEGNTGMDDSDAGFVIQARDTVKPTVTVVAPNSTTKKLTGGAAVSVTWISGDNVGVSSHQILLSADDGLTFPTPLATGVAGAAQTFSVMLPNQKIGQGKIKVVATDAAGNSGEGVSTTFKVKPRK